MAQHAHHFTSSRTPLAFVLALVQAYAQRGINADATLQKAQIAPAQLHDPAARITAMQFGRISGAAMQDLDDEALGWFSRLACWLVNSRIALTKAQFPSTASAHQDVYQVLFSAPAQITQAQATIEFDENYLTLPLRRDEVALRHMLQRALPLTVLQYRRDRLLVQRVRQAFATQPE